jgi:hypothetical protein
LSIAGWFAVACLQKGKVKESVCLEGCGVVRLEKESLRMTTDLWRCMDGMIGCGKALVGHVDVAGYSAVKLSGGCSNPI